MSITSFVDKSEYQRSFKVCSRAGEKMVKETVVDISAFDYFNQIGEIEKIPKEIQCKVIEERFLHFLGEFILRLPAVSDEYDLKNGLLHCWYSTIPVQESFSRPLKKEPGYKSFPTEEIFTRLKEKKEQGEIFTWNEASLLGFFNAQGAIAQNNNCFVFWTSPPPKDGTYSFSFVTRAKGGKVELLALRHQLSSQKQARILTELTGRAIEGYKDTLTTPAVVNPEELSLLQLVQKVFPHFTQEDLDAALTNEELGQYRFLAEEFAEKFIDYLERFASGDEYYRLITAYGNYASELKKRGFPQTALGLSTASFVSLPNSDEFISHWAAVGNLQIFGGFCGGFGAGIAEQFLSNPLQRSLPSSERGGEDKEKVYICPRCPYVTVKAGQTCPDCGWQAPS